MGTNISETILYNTFKIWKCKNEISETLTHNENCLTMNIRCLKGIDNIKNDAQICQKRLEMIKLEKNIISFSDW